MKNTDPVFPPEPSIPEMNLVTGGFTYGAITYDEPSDACKKKENITRINMESPNLLVLMMVVRLCASFSYVYTSLVYKFITGTLVGIYVG